MPRWPRQKRLALPAAVPRVAAAPRVASVDFTQLPYQPDDAPALTALLNELDEHAGAEAGLTEDEVHLLVSTQVDDLATDTALVVDPDGVLVEIGRASCRERGRDWWG